MRRALVTGGLCHTMAHSTPCGPRPDLLSDLQILTFLVSCSCWAPACLPACEEGGCIPIPGNFAFQGCHFHLSPKALLGWPEHPWQPLQEPQASLTPFPHKGWGGGKK